MRQPFSLMGLILTVWLIAVPARAQWSQAGQDYIANFNKGMITCDPTQGGAICQAFINIGSYLDTLVGTLAMVIHYGGPNVTYPGGIPLDAQLPNHPFVDATGHDQPIHLVMYRPQNASGDVKNIPIVVFLPGIFGDAKAVQSYVATKLLLKEGYQVLVVPNPLSGEYLRSYPVVAPGSFKAEAEVILSVVKYARQNLINSSTTLSLIGGSYGAYIGSRFVGLVDEHPEIAELVDGQVSLLEPPLSMNVAISRVDKMVVKSMTYRIHGISGEQFGDVFHKGLENLVRWMQREYKEHKAAGFTVRNYAEGAKKVFDSFDAKDSADQDKLQFRWIVNEMEPENKAQYVNGQDLAGHWLGVAAQHGFTRVRILAADNDILSRKQEVKTLPEEFQTPSHLLIRAGGGHVGFIDEGMFSKFADIEFHQNPQ